MSCKPADMKMCEHLSYQHPFVRWGGDRKIIRKPEDQVD